MFFFVWKKERRVGIIVENFLILELGIEEVFV